MKPTDILNELSLILDRCRSRDEEVKYLLARIECLRQETVVDNTRVEELRRLAKGVVLTD